MSVAIIIPARLNSTRLARKLLLDLCGKSVLQRTYEQACKSSLADKVVIATDSTDIADTAEKFGARAIMTRDDHQSGSDRIAEAAAAVDAEIIINIQGDEPEIEPAHIDALIDAHARSRAFAATLATPFPPEIDPAYPAAVKAVLGAPIDANDSLYWAKDFSRIAPAGVGRDDLHLHLGAYAYSRDALMRFVSAPRGRREVAESLEQLRILEMGETIAVRRVGKAMRGIDTEQDLAAARARLLKG